MHKVKYTEPEMEIIVFQNEDVIIASPLNGNGAIEGLPEELFPQQ